MKQIIKEMIEELAYCLEPGETLNISVLNGGRVVPVIMRDGIPEKSFGRVVNALATRIKKEKQNESSDN